MVIEQHRHAGVFIARGKEDALVTFNMAPGIRWDSVLAGSVPGSCNQQITGNWRTE